MNLKSKPGLTTRPRNGLDLPRYSSLAWHLFVLLSCWHWALMTHAGAFESKEEENEHGNVIDAVTEFVFPRVISSTERPWCGWVACGS